MGLRTRSEILKKIREDVLKWSKAQLVRKIKQIGEDLGNTHPDYPAYGNFDSATVRRAENFINLESTSIELICRGLEIKRPWQDLVDDGTPDRDLSFYLSNEVSDNYSETENQFRYPTTIDQAQVKSPYDGSNISASCNQPPDNFPDYRNRYFSGRLATLEQVIGLLADHGLAALYGISGVGKSSIAIEVGNRNRRQYEYRFWLDATSKDSLSRDIGLITLLLLLPERKEESNRLNRIAVRHWLQTHDNWLIVLDNVEDHQAVAEFLPETPWQGHVLFTSKSSDFGALGIPKQVKVPVRDFSPAEAKAFLTERAGCESINHLPDEEQKAVQAIVKELAGFPWALELVGSFISRTPGVSFSDYYKTYRHQKQALLDKGMVKGGYPDSFSTIWEISFEQVEYRLKTSAIVLKASAFLASESIPLEIWTEGHSAFGGEVAESLNRWSEEPVLLNEILSPLLDFSFITIDDSQQSYSLHPLVQQTLLARVGKSEKHELAESLTKTLLHLLPKNPYIELPRWSLLGPHIQSILSVGANTGSEFFTRLTNEWVVFLISSGRYSDAERYLFSALEPAKKLLGCNHAEVMECMHYLGVLLYEQGRLKDADRSLRQLVLKCNSGLSGNEKLMPQIFNSLALVNCNLRRLTEAEANIRQAISLTKKHSNSEPIEMGIQFGNLGMILHDQERYREAEQAYNRAQRWFKTYRGFDSTLLGAASLVNLANLYRDTGRLSKSRRLFERVMDGFEKDSANADPVVKSACLSGFGALRLKTGQLDVAEACFLKSVQIRSRLYPEGHPDLAWSHRDIASLYRTQRRFEPALKHAQLALNMFRMAGGDHELNINGPLDTIVSIHQSLGQYGQADLLLREKLRQLTSSQGKRHPLVGRCLNDLAFNRRLRQRHKDGKVFFKKAIEIAQDDPDSHDLLFDSLWKLASLFRDSGNLDQAIDYYQRAISLGEKFKLSDFETRANILSNLSGIYAEAGRGNDAESLLGKAYPLVKRIQGEKFSSQALVLAQHASLMLQSGRYEEFKKLLVKASASLDKAPGFNRYPAACVISNIGDRLLDRCRYQEAEHCYLLALGSFESFSGANFDARRTALGGLFISQIKAQKWDAAQLRFRELLELCFEDAPEGQKQLPVSEIGIFLHALHERNRLKEAIELCRSILIRSSRNSSLDPLSVVEVRLLFARMLEFGGQSAEKDAELLEAANTLGTLKVRGFDRQTQVLVALGHTQLALGNDAKARESLQSAWRLQESNGQSNSVAALTLSVFLGNLEWKTKKYDQAEKWFMNALALARRHDSSRPEYSVHVRLKLSNLYLAAKRYEDARQRMKELLRFTEKAPEQWPEARADTLEGLATVSLHENSFGERMDYLHEALKIKKQMLGDQHSSVKSIQERIDKTAVQMQPDQSDGTSES